MNQEHTEPPIPNLLVIRSDDIHRAVEFYQAMGMTFDLHSHGNGPNHYASEFTGFVFEIYPKQSKADDTNRTRLGFRVGNVEGVVESLRKVNVSVLTEPADTEWGRRAVIRDFDGHTVELVTPPDCEKKAASRP